MEGPTMKPFELHTHLVTLGGVFYPTGHVLLMLPDREHAEQAARLVAQVGALDEEMSLLPPETVLGPIRHTVDMADDPLPSAGAEAEMVRQMVRLADQGHWGLLVHAPRTPDADKVMQAVRELPVAMAERYRHLVIEDL